MLDRLKSDLATRHIPVCVISTEEESSRSISLGARGVVHKPIKTKETLDQLFGTIRSYVERSDRDLLFVWPDESEHAALLEVLEHDGIRVRFVRDGSEALGALDEATFDCVILGIPPRGGAPRETLGEIARQSAVREIPVLVFAPSLLDPEREAEVQGLARTAGTPRGALPREAPRPRDPGAAPAGGPPPPGKAGHHRGDLLHGPGARGQARPDRRRRHPQHLRAHERAGAPEHGRALGGNGQGRHRKAPEGAWRRHRPDGHHDARHGRLRHDARDPQDGPVPRSCRSSPSPRRP